MRIAASNPSVLNVPYSGLAGGIDSERNNCLTERIISLRGKRSCHVTPVRLQEASWRQFRSEGADMRGLEIEPTFANAMHWPDAGDCDGRVSEPFEPGHHVQSRLCKLSRRASGLNSRLHATLMRIVAHPPNTTEPMTPSAAAVSPDSNSPS